MFRLPLVRLWPASRCPTWLSSTQSVCSGCGSESISWTRESELMNVTWLPRATVMVFGHTWLFMIVMVVGLELAVHVPVGPVVGELLHDMAAASAAAAIRPPVTFLTLRMLFVSLSQAGSLRF